MSKRGANIGHRRKGEGLTKAQIRNILLASQGDTCTICDKYMLPSEVTFDHIIPKSKGGTNRRDNLQLVHSWCNQEKGDKLAMDERH